MGRLLLLGGEIKCDNESLRGEGYARSLQQSVNFFRFGFQLIQGFGSAK
jgi:hypothetical protein